MENQGKETLIITGPSIIGAMFGFTVGILTGILVTILTKSCT